MAISFMEFRSITRANRRTVKATRRHDAKKDSLCKGKDILYNKRPDYQPCSHNMNLSVFGEIVVLLGASVFINFIFHKLRLPAVIGFILTGMLVGPSFLSLVENTGMITFLAEVGGDVLHRQGSVPGR